MTILCRNNRSQYRFQRPQHQLNTWRKMSKSKKMATSNMAGSTIWNYKMGQADFCFIHSALIFTQYMKMHVVLHWWRLYYRKNTTIRLTEFRDLLHGRCREAQSSVHPFSLWLSCCMRFHCQSSTEVRGHFREIQKEGEKPPQALSLRL